MDYWFHIVDMDVDIRRVVSNTDNEHYNENNHHHDHQQPDNSQITLSSIPTPTS